MLSTKRLLASELLGLQGILLARKYARFLRDFLIADGIRRFSRLDRYSTWKE